MVCHGGFRLDEAKRRSWYDPEDILQALQLEEGMTFTDIGCGDGFFTFMAAKIVGEEGHVYAVDVDSVAIEKIKKRATEEGFKNITAIVGKAEDTIPCRGCVDVAFFSMNLHDFDHPEKALYNAREMLNLEGIVADLDWKKEEIPFGPPLDVKFDTETVSCFMRSQGFMVQCAFDVGPYHYLVIARKGL
jgi:ubiquinone/menaquinone biosynthesis C-methylase UbiE